MMRRSRGRANPTTSNPNHMQCMAIRAAALAQLGRADEAKQATELLLDHYPWLTVQRLLSNIRWKRPEDIAHYREGLLKAGVPAARRQGGLDRARDAARRRILTVQRCG